MRLKFLCASSAVIVMTLTVTATAADVARGKRLYEARCGACHAIAENGPGPRQQGLFGCIAGSQPGYDYSEALATSGIVWDNDTLDRWLADPNALVPGNKMAVRLANEASDRADLIAYLREATRGESECKTPPPDTAPETQK